MQDLAQITFVSVTAGRNKYVGNFVRNISAENNNSRIVSVFVGLG